MSYERKLSSVQKLAVMEDILKTGIVEIPVGGEAWTLSRGLMQLYGFAVEPTDIINSIGEILHPDDKENYRADLVLMRAGVAPPSRFFKIIKANGTTHHMSVQFHTLTNEMGAVQKFVGIVRDVTDEAVLRGARGEASRQLTAVMHAMNVDSLFRIDPQGGLFDYVSRGPLRGFKSVLGRAWEDLIPPEERPQTLKAIMRGLADGEPFCLPVRALCGDGEIRPYIDKLFPVRDEGGTIIEWCGTLSSPPEGDFNQKLSGVTLEAAAKLATSTTIRALCSYLGWTHIELAAMSRLSSSTISRMTITAGLLTASFRAKSVVKVMAAFQAGGIEYNLTPDGRISISRFI